MIPASTPLLRKPTDIDLNEVEFDWQNLRQSILDTHKQIADMFFQGHGNELQYKDSCIAEKVMLQFIKSDDAPVLPVHDSFIMHHAFGRDITVKSEIGVLLPSSFDGMDVEELTIEQIVHGPPEYSQWESRN